MREVSIRVARMRGAALGDRVLAEIQAVRTSTTRADGPPAPRPSIFWHVWDAPVYTIGSSSYLDELVSAAGAVNIFGDRPASAPQVSLEEVVRRDPDFVLAGPTSAPKLLVKRGFFPHNLIRSRDNKRRRGLRHSSFALIRIADVRENMFLRRAIETPAQLSGSDIEPGLVDQLSQEVADQPGALPLLQYALDELWKKSRELRSDKLTTAVYHTPRGRDINHVGIVPSVKAKDDPKTRRDEALERALRFIATGR